MGLKNHGPLSRHFTQMRFGFDVFHSITSVAEMPPRRNDFALILLSGTSTDHTNWSACRLSKIRRLAKSAAFA
jgi:hypothetical protein